jgi:hypothetical protein
MRFLRELEAALPEFQIMMKVRAAALLRPVGGSEQERERLLRRVSQKEFDFVLVKQSFAACAIELDDRTHERPERRSRDRQLDRICERAGLPLIRFRVVRDYRRDEIREAVLSRLGHRAEPTPSPCSERKLCASIAPGDGGR